MLGCPRLSENPLPLFGSDLDLVLPTASAAAVTTPVLQSGKIKPHRRHLAVFSIRLRDLRT
jgi:hypothetical protein